MSYVFNDLSTAKTHLASIYDYYSSDYQGPPPQYQREKPPQYENRPYTEQERNYGEFIRERLWLDIKRRTKGVPHPFRTTRLVFDSRDEIYEAFMWYGHVFNVDLPHVEINGPRLVERENEDYALSLGYISKKKEEVHRSLGELNEEENQGDGTVTGVGPMPRRRNKVKQRRRPQGPMQMYHSVKENEFGTFRYALTSTLNDVGAVGANNYYALNNLSTPLIGGAVPVSGVINYTNLFLNCRVHTAVITVNYANNENFNTEAYLCYSAGINPPAGNNSAGNSASLRYLRTQRDCKHLILGPLTGNNKGTLRYRFNMVKMLGIKDPGVVDSYTQVGASGSFSAPTTTVYAVAGISSPATNLVSGVLIDVTIDYYVRFFGLQAVS